MPLTLFGRGTNLQMIARWNLLWSGEWTSVNTYSENDAVSYDGSVYISKQNANTNNLPTDTAWWSIFVEKGEVGSTGTQGIPGQNGANGSKGDKGDPGELISTPPVGCYKVTNLYVNQNGKLAVVYDDTPQP